MLLRERFWLWGHPEGTFNGRYGLNNEKLSRMTPMECCLYLGIKNTFMIPAGMFQSNRRQYNKSFKTLREVGWDCFNAGIDPDYTEHIIKEARDFENITCVVFNDFVRNGFYKQIPLENLRKAHELLHSNEVRPLYMWMSIDTRHFGQDRRQDNDFMRYIDPFDGVIMWTGEERDVALIPEKFEIFKRMTREKRRMLGCFLYNYGEKKEVSSESVLWQLDWYREKLLEGEAEGIVLRSNTTADLDFKAYDTACEWLEKHGDEEIEDI